MQPIAVEDVKPNTDVNSVAAPVVVVETPVASALTPQTNVSQPQTHAHHDDDEDEKEDVGTDDISQPVQLLSFKGLADMYKTNIDLNNPKESSGLTAEEAEARLKTDGPNQLTPPPETPEILKYLHFYTDPFMLLLLLAGLLSCIAYGLDKTQPINLYIGIILFIVVFVSSTFSYVQAGKASDVMKRFKTMMPAKCTVIRTVNGKKQQMQVDASSLVVGDLVRVGTGDQIPADLRLIYCAGLKVEASALTGESEPIKCVIRSKELKIQEVKNVTFNTAKALEGDGIGVVYATGDHTYVGGIARLTTSTTDEDSTLQREIKIFVKSLTVFAFIIGVIFFVVGMSRGQKWINAFINGFIVVMIANVPEGLPMTVVSALTITAKHLGELNVFVKELKSVETLGSATVIASDKTGTLTKNQMSVNRLWFDLRVASADSITRDAPMQTLRRGQAMSTMAGLTLQGLEICAGCCNSCVFEDEKQLTPEEAGALDMSETLKNLDANMTLRSAKAIHPMFLQNVDPTLTMKSALKKYTLKNDDTQRKTRGDASDTALFNYIKTRHNIELLRFHHKKIYELKFNSRNKFAIVITKPNHQESKDHRRRLLMKGAPEVILTKCTHYMFSGQIIPMDEDFKQAFQEVYEAFGNNGERVLGFAQTMLDENQYPPTMDDSYDFEKNNFPTTGLCFLGLMSLIDPPKDTVADAVTLCHTAGVRVMMVTGDHPLTAAAIARQIGIITLPTRDELARIKNCKPEQVDEAEVGAEVVKGSQIDSFTEADWNRVLAKKEIVFARTTPQHKLQIVTNLQRLGEIVAVTGDGVNDSPALKKADIGVAMGISGSDVARDAAAVILMDDDFSSIVVGIKEGRTIFDNLAKTIAYTITHMIPEVIPVLLNLAIGLPLCLSAILILFIDLGTELAPAVSLAYEKSESDVMARPPRNARTDRLVTWQIVGYLTIAGIVECLVCFLAYFLVFDYYGIPASKLIFTADKYWQPDAPNFEYNGIVLDDKAQQAMLAEAQTAYWMILTFSQVVHIFACKARKLSIFEHGLFQNMIMNMGVIIEILLILFIIFLPPLHDIYITRNFPGKIWAVMLISQFVLFAWSEIRKKISRDHPHSFVATKLNW